MTDRALAQALRNLVREDAGLIAQLRAVRELGLADACIGAGAVRRLVWDARFGQGLAAGTSPDVDVVYLDDQPWTPTRDAALARRLSSLLPGVPWEVVHQAHVPGPRCGSLAEALSRWPETATAVGVRLGADDGIEVLAPLGLDDLFDGVVRCNPRCPDVEAFATRLAAKRWTTRWPGLRVVSDALRG